MDQKWTAFLVIDMQNDFCSPGGAAHKTGADLSMYADIVPKIVRFRQVCREMRVLVIHIRLVRLPDGKSDSPSWLRLRMRKAREWNADDPEMWKDALEGAWGAEFVSGLTPEKGELVVTKFRSSAFRETSLDLILRSNGIRTVLVAGCTTEGCVESTVRDVGFYDYFPVVLEDCVGSDVRELHEASLLVMSAYRADVTRSDAVATIWATTTRAR